MACSFSTSSAAQKWSPEHAFVDAPSITPSRVGISPPDLTRSAGRTRVRARVTVVNQVALALQNPILGIGEVSADLAPP